MFKRVANRAGDVFFIHPLLERFWADRLKGKAVCLCYHRIDDPRNHAFLSKSGYPAIKQEELKADIFFLKSLGFQFITFEEWRKKGALDPGRPYAILTFDDCFRDNYENGLPVFEEAGVKAVFFQVISMVDSKDLLWEQKIFWHSQINAGRFTEAVRALFPGDEQAARLSGLDLGYHLVEGVPFERIAAVVKTLDETFPGNETRQMAAEVYATTAHLTKARAAGHELASHGHLHYKRVNVSAREFEDDLKVSIEKLRPWMGRGELSYAYPHGNYMDGDKEICAKYFKHVATVRRGVIGPGTDPLDLPRFYWGGTLKNPVRRKRWLLTGEI